MVLLLAKKVTVLAKYMDFADVFLEESKKLPYGPIYSLKPVELKSLKIYIETILANGFIKGLKLPARAPILFVHKLNDSICLCVNYWGLNNLTIKNQYPLPLIGKSVDWLNWAKQFTELNFTSAYHWMRIKESDK